MSAWIRTFSGVSFYPLDPRPEDIRLADIAHALALQNRFTGHTTRPWSIAEHSLLVARLVTAEDRLSALLHDASEAYLSDISRPMKATETFAEYRIAEARLQGMIYARFGVVDETPAVKYADMVACGIEAHYLMGVRRGEGWPAVDHVLTKWSPLDSQHEAFFLPDQHWRFAEEDFLRQVLASHHQRRDPPRAA